jgi:hypothetical protein
LKVQTLTGCIGRHDQADLPLLDRVLDVLAFDRGEVFTPEKATLARTRIDTDGLTSQCLGDLGTDPIYRVWQGDVLLEFNNSAFDGMFAIFGN